MNMLQTIERCAGYRGMSDQQRDHEWELQKRLFAAEREFRAALEAVHEGSAVIPINIDAFNDFCHDEMPTEAHWDERISEARAV